MPSFLRNVRFALRSLAKSPGSTGAIVLTIAFGIGGNAAIFSLFSEIVLRPLPVASPWELVNLGAPGPKPGSVSCDPAGDCSHVFSYPMFRDLREDVEVFAGMAAHRSFYSANVAHRGTAQSATVMFVSGDYFRLLGLNPSLGRLLDAGDEDSARVAVLSHSYWQNDFGSDPNVLNDALVINGEPLTIVGVAPPGFTGTTFGRSSQIFVPLALYPRKQAAFENRRDYWLYVFARLAPGVSVSQARTALNASYKAIVNDVEAPLQEGLNDWGMAFFRAKEATLESGSRGQSLMLEAARIPTVMLLIVTTTVLLIACANIACLLLARIAANTGSLAVRMSLGAERRHLVAQFLSESFLLALAGAMLAVPVAMVTLKMIFSLVPSDIIAMMNLEIGVDVSTVKYASALALGSVLLFGLFPSMQGTRLNISAVLNHRAGRAGSHRAGARVRSSMAMTQVALSMALLVLAGLFAKSMFNVSRVDLGMQVEGLMTFGLSPSLNGYSPERAAPLFDRLEDELAAVPGVSGVTSSTVPLFANSFADSPVSVEGFEPGPDADVEAYYNRIAANFFGVIGMSMLAGREFKEDDESGPAKVAIVNEAFARKFHLGEHVIGKRMAIGAGQENLDVEIVGLVRDARYGTVKDANAAQFFTPHRQGGGVGSLAFYVRSSLPPEQLTATIYNVVSGLDPVLPVERVKTMENQVQDNVFVDYLVSTVSVAFAALAALLAAVGLYGILSYTVAQRTSEIGLRAALGATPRQLRAMVLNEVGRLSLIGGAIGLIAALSLGYAAASLLFEVRPYDVSVVIAAVVLLGLIAVGASYVPASRAASIKPTEALRLE